MRHSALPVRPATRREIPAVEAVCRAAYEEYRNEISAAVFTAYIRDLRRLAAHWDEAAVLVAESDGRFAGCVLFYGDASLEGLGLPPEWACFSKLAVVPEMRGRGIGRCLVETCIREARDIRSAAIALHTASFMRAACRIYERIGFRRCPEYDVTASHMLHIDAQASEVAVIAYRLELTSS